MLVTLLDSTKRVTLFGQVLEAPRTTIEVNKVAMLNASRVDGRDRSSYAKDVVALFRAGLIRVDDGGRQITTLAELTQLLEDGELDNPNAVTSFVFKPGGVASANVFTEWAALVAAAQGLEGMKHVYFDDSLEPTNIPEGEWDFGSGYTTWNGKPPHLGQSVVTFQDGAVLVGGVYEFRRVALRSQSKSAAMRLRGSAVSGAYFHLLQNSTLRTESDGPFFACNVQATAFWVLHDACNIKTGDALAPALLAESRNSSIMAILYDVSQIDVDTINWLPNAGASAIVVHPTAQIALDHFHKTLTVNYARPSIRYGEGDPEGKLVGYVGDMYVDTHGGSGTTLYVKEAGDGLNTGWRAK